ncbi:MAG: response regulator [Verrucomicrobia bacterium]|nr:response regulator [Verrucomicrobiota bacterium]
MIACLPHKESASTGRDVAPLAERPVPAAFSSENQVAPALAVFLRQRRKFLLDLWVETARQDAALPSTEKLDGAALADHLPRLFDDLADALHGRPFGEQAIRDAAQHGEVRWQQGHRMAEVIRELSLLARLVLEHGLDAFVDVDPDSVPRAARLRLRERVLLFFEAVTAAAVERYSQKQQEEREALNQRLIEARAQSAAAVEAERARLAEVFKHTPSIMALLQGPEHVIEMINDSYVQLIGPRDVIGKPLREALPELVGQGVVEVLDHVFASGEAFVRKNRRVQLGRQAGQSLVEHYFDVVYQPIPAADGSMAGILAHSVDVTDRHASEVALTQVLDAERAARTEIERAGRMKDEFLANLSHELRTPLNAILGWSLILRSGGLPDDTARWDELNEGLAVIERNARAQNKIIEDLLDMSRIISGKVRLDVQRLDLATVVEAAIETVRPAADAKGIRILAALDADDASPIFGDANRLQQVFWNLLSNAVKFTPKGGRVRLHLQCVNAGSLEVHVIDTGDGIPPDFLPHVFDRFRQADASITRQHGGLGLGLAIVKQLSELHGGTVRAQSDGRGQGTTFTVTLPLTAARHLENDEPEPTRRQQAAAPPSPAVSERWDFHGVKVLFVDDEEDMRALARRLLEGQGASVVTAGSVKEAMAWFETETPDVLVSDIGMPGEDGYALIRWVRSLAPEEGGKVPALAVTAYARAEDRARATEAGFHLHLAKPVEPPELLRLVARLAGRTNPR